MRVPFLIGEMATASRKKTRSEPGKCIFCGKLGLTKEHIFSDWLKEILPRREKDKHIDVVIDGFPENAPLNREQVMKDATDIRVQSGAANSKTVKVVCGSRGRFDRQYCNDGWMSRLDERTKAILTPLVNGDEASITTEAQETLSAWAAKSTITAEFLARNSVAIQDSERHYLMANLKPPPHWKVSIAPHDGDLWYTGYHHFATRLDASGKPVSGPKNIQSTLFGIGRLLIHVVSAPPGLDAPSEGVRFEAFRQIWPRSGNTISWPTERFLNDIEAGQVAVSLRNAVNSQDMAVNGGTSNFITNAQTAPRRRTVLKIGIPDARSASFVCKVRPAFKGDGNEDLICGGCGLVLSEGFTGPEIYNRIRVDHQLLFGCPCGTYNKITTAAQA